MRIVLVAQYLRAQRIYDMHSRTETWKRSWPSAGPPTLQPEYAVACCRTNSLGHPVPEQRFDRRHPLQCVIHSVARDHHSVFSPRTFMVEAVLARRFPEFTFECATEGRFRFVSHFAGDFRYTPRRI